jgi:hypothetical protein
MTNRREFVMAGLAASALPLAARADFADLEAAIPLYKILYDTRFPASVAFARRAAAAGAAIQAMSGDITRFWYDDLYHRWLQEPAAIAGFTAHGALFCLEQLAWERRMRVVYRGEHAALDGCVTHRFTGPAPTLEAALSATAEPAWSEALAGVVGACPPGPLQRDTVQTTTVAGTLAPPSEPLFSWVIAAVERA